MKNKSEIGARIQHAREFRQMDRSTLAKAVGCSYREILRWETTSREPHAVTLKKIADALDMKLDYFLLEKPFEEESKFYVAFYLKEETYHELFGYNDLPLGNRRIAKKCIDVLDSEHDLKVTASIVNGALRIKDLYLVYTIIHDDILGLDIDPMIAEEELHPDDARALIKDTFMDVSDIEKLQAINKVLLTYMPDEAVRDVTVIIQRAAMKALIDAGEIDENGRISGTNRYWSYGKIKK